MHKSSNPNNFRNKKYIQEMDKQFKTMFRSYHKYIAYRNKLLNELTLNEEDKNILDSIDLKFKKNMERASKRIQKEDFQCIK